MQLPSQRSSILIGVPLQFRMALNTRLPAEADIGMTDNPYTRENGKPTHLPSVFAFIDILGYVQLVEEAEASGTQQQFLEKAHGALSEGRKWLEYMNDETLKNLDDTLSGKKRYALKAFTDNIVIGWPIYDDAESECGDAFRKLAHFQFQMIVSGFFVRGAISIGNAYIDDIVVSGDALVEAYEAEAILARDPRIVLTSSAVKIVQSHLEYYSPPTFAPQDQDLLSDSDGQWFINYLDSVVNPGDDIQPEYEHLLKHKESVEFCLSKYKSAPSIFSKYTWVAGYHNYFCDLHEESIGDEYRIETDLFRALPKSILKNAK